MSSSRIISTITRPIIIGHICSDCGYPVLSVMQVEAKAEKTYSIMQSKAQRIAEDAANSAIDKEIHAIEQCKQSHAMLTSSVKKHDDGWNGLFSETSISGFDVACPHCLSFEPWKRKKCKKKMEELAEENFPRVFKNYEEAELWGLNYNYDMIKSIESRSYSDEIVVSAKKQAVSLYYLIKDLKEQKDMLPELKQRNIIKEEYDILLSQKEKIGLLDFKNKKKINEKCKILAKRLENMDTAISNRKNKINLQIKENRVQLHNFQLLGYGTTGKNVINKLKETICFLVEPNKIPSDDLKIYGFEYMNKTSIGDNAFGNINTNKEHNPIDLQPIFCKKCGFKLIPNSVFCTKCGSSVMDI